MTNLRKLFTSLLEGFLVGTILSFPFGFWEDEYDVYVLGAIIAGLALRVLVGFLTWRSEVRQTEVVRENTEPETTESQIEKQLQEK